MDTTGADGASRGCLLSGRDYIDDIDVVLAGLFLDGKPNINTSIRTRWNADRLIEPPHRSKALARQLRRCLELPTDFKGIIRFNIHKSRLSSLPSVEGTDGHRREIQLR